MDNRSYKVKEEHVSNRVDKMLTELNSEYSRQQVQSWIKEDLVFVNKKLVKANYKVRLEDLLEWTIPAVVERIIEAEDIPLNILYEDEQVIVINKVRGMVVHPTSMQNTGTLVNALMNHTENLSTLNGVERPGIVHRLDKDTSGIMVVAKTDKAHENLQQQFANHSVYRQYEAVVFGVIAHDNGIIDAPIARDPNNRLRMAVVPGGKPAETHFNVLERYKQHTLVNCELITGRTHQIRVHMKYIKHAIVGDPTYCRKKSKLLTSQALFSKKLSFVHPTTNEEMSFVIERPSHIENLLNHLAKMA